MNGMEFAFGIVVVSTAGWLISSWIRAKHGYPIENEWSGMTCKSDGGAERAVAFERARELVELGVLAVGLTIDPRRFGVR